MKVDATGAHHVPLPDLNDVGEAAVYLYQFGWHKEVRERHPNKVRWIKAFRTLTKCGLREAKLAYEVTHQGYKGTQGEMK